MADLITSREHNAGKADDPFDLVATRAAAQARANADPRGPVAIYQHVGGRHPKQGMVAGNGSYIWRDVADDRDQVYDPPKFFWQLVETVNPQ